MFKHLAILVSYCVIVSHVSNFPNICNHHKLIFVLIISGIQPKSTNYSTTLGATHVYVTRFTMIQPEMHFSSLAFILFSLWQLKNTWKYY